VIGNSALKVFRWLNLAPLPTKEDMEPKDITRIFQIESRMNPASRSEYLNPTLGDLSYELICDIYKCPFYTMQKDPALNIELTTLL
jgi:hypothetical protein